MLAALDSNIIIYAEDIHSDERHSAAQKLVEQIKVDRIVLPLQSVGETLSWLIRKGGIPKAIAADRMEDWTGQFATQSTTLNVFKLCRELVALHDFQVWDAVILASAAEAGADILLSEDMQHGFTWRGVTIVNPFLKEPSSLLLKLIKE